MPRKTYLMKSKKGGIHDAREASLCPKAEAHRDSWNDPAEELRKKIRVFAKERDWDQFHTPKNLAMALAVEAAELMEIFQWLTPAESLKLGPAERAQVEDEIGDVVIYLVRLADRLSISPLEAARKKLEKSRVKYPVERVRGNAKKYTEF